MNNHKFNTFDDTTLEYAKNIKAIKAVEENFDQYCQYFIREINDQLIKKTVSIFTKHRGYKFKLEDDGVEDHYSSIVLFKGKTKIIEFSYGFDDDIRIKNSEEFLFSQEGSNFYALLSILPKITEDKKILKKYWNDELENYFVTRGFGIHDHKDDNDIWVYLITIAIDENFVLPQVISELFNKFNELFKNKKAFELFSTYIPKNIELSSK